MQLPIHCSKTTRQQQIKLLFKTDNPLAFSKDFNCLQREKVQWLLTVLSSGKNQITLSLRQWCQCPVFPITATGQKQNPVGITDKNCFSPFPPIVLQRSQIHFDNSRTKKLPITLNRVGHKIAGVACCNANRKKTSLLSVFSIGKIGSETIILSDKAQGFPPVASSQSVPN